MSKSKKITLIIAAAVILALLVMLGVTGAANGTVPCPDCDATTVAECETCGGDASVRGTIWALLPPVIAIGLALITKEVFSSLFIGIQLVNISDGGKGPRSKGENKKWQKIRKLSR